MPDTPAVFEADAQFRVIDTGGDHVRYEGKIFHGGDFPERFFSINEEELETAVQSFLPVRCDIQHDVSIFDAIGLGKLNRVWRDGLQLFGEISVPRWLHNLFKDKDDGKLKVSIEFQPWRKRIIGLAYCVNPAIADAAIQAGFTSRPYKPGEQSEQTQPVDDPGEMGEDTLNKEEVGIFRRLKSAFSGSGEETPGAENARLTAVETDLASLKDSVETGFADLKETLSGKKPEGADSQTPEQIAEAEAAAFAEDQVKAGRIAPNRRDGCAAAFKAAKLSGDEKALEEVKASYAAGSSGAETLQKPAVTVGTPEENPGAYNDDGTLKVDPSIFKKFNKKPAEARN